MLSEVLGHHTQSAVLCCPHSEDCCIAHKQPQAKALDRKVTLGQDADFLCTGLQSWHRLLSVDTHPICGQQADTLDPRRLCLHSPTPASCEFAYVYVNIMISADITHLLPG